MKDALLAVFNAHIEMYNKGFRRLVVDRFFLFLLRFVSLPPSDVTLVESTRHNVMVISALRCVSFLLTRHLQWQNAVERFFILLGQESFGCHDTLCGLLWASRVIQ